jgi:hypothetical protein
MKETQMCYTVLHNLKFPDEAESYKFVLMRTLKVVILLLVRTSYLATRRQWVSQSVRPSVLALSSSGNHDQSLAVVKTVAVLFLVERSPCQEEESVT